MSNATTAQTFTAAKVASRIRREAEANNEEPWQATRENVRGAIEDIPGSGQVEVSGNCVRWINAVARIVEESIGVRRGTWS